MAGRIRAVSFQTVAEMRFGALNKGWGPRRRDEMESSLSGFQVIGYSDELGHFWAELRVAARKAGRALAPGDAWILATAALLDVPLLTHDKDFDAGVFSRVEIICHAP